MTAAENDILLKRISTCHDQQALQQLFTAYYPRLVRFALSLLHNHSVAEEIAEDVFIKLWEKRTALPIITSLPAYLLTAVRNGVLNHQRLLKNQAYLNLDAVHTELTAGWSNPEQRLISAETLRQINAAITSLPPQCRLIFQLVKEDGMKYREAAELLHLSVKTVEAQMGLALRKISEVLVETGVGLPENIRRKK